MNADHVIALVVVLVVAWILIRWGTLILVCFGLYHFSMGQWTEGTLALIYAGVIAFVKAGVTALARLSAAVTGKRSADTL